MTYYYVSPKHKSEEKVEAVEVFNFLEPDPAPEWLDGLDFRMAEATTASQGTHAILAMQNRANAEKLNIFLENWKSN